MQFHALLAAIMAMLSFAMAETTLTQTVQSTHTVTMTLTNYNATQTMYYSTGTGGTGGSTLPHSTTGTGFHSPSLTASPTSTTSPGAASNQRANFAFAGLMGVAAMALAL